MSEAGVSETFYRLFDSAPSERICVVLPEGGAIRFGAMATRSRGIAACAAAMPSASG